MNRFELKFIAWIGNVGYWLIKMEKGRIADFVCTEEEEMEAKEWATELHLNLEALVDQLSGADSASDLMPLSAQRDEAEVLEEACNTLLMYAAACRGCRLLLVQGLGGMLLKPLSEDAEEELPMPDDVLTKLTDWLKTKLEMSGGVGFIAMRFEGREFDTFARCIPAKTGERLSVYIVERI